MIHTDKEAHFSCVQLVLGLSPIPWDGLCGSPLPFGKTLNFEFEEVYGSALSLLFQLSPSSPFLPSHILVLLSAVVFNAFQVLSVLHLWPSYMLLLPLWLPLYFILVNSAVSFLY